MPLRSDGNELRRQRELRGMTQAEFARRSGYTPTHVSQVELGNSNAGPRYLRQAARIFGCTIRDITCGELPVRRRTDTTADQEQAAVA